MQPGFADFANPGRDEPTEHRTHFRRRTGQEHQIDRTVGIIDRQDRAGCRTMIIIKHPGMFRHQRLFPVIICDMDAAQLGKVGGDPLPAVFICLERDTSEFGGSRHGQIIAGRSQTAGQDDQV